MAIAIRILLSAVRILLGPGGSRRTGEMRPVAGIRMSPVPVPLSGVRRWVALVPVLLRVPVVVLSVLRPVGVTGRVGPGVTSVIHGDPFDTRPTFIT